MSDIILDNDEIFETLDKLYDEDKYDDIIGIITKIPRQKWSNKLWFRLIGAYNNSEKFGESLRELKEIFPRCQTHEDKARYYYQRGYICYKTDHELAARHLYERGLEADPDDTLNLKAEIEECNGYIVEDMHKLAEICYRVRDTLRKHCASGMGRVKYKISEDEFIMRLAYLPAIRRIPGTEHGLGFANLTKQFPDAEKPAVKAFLKRNFGIVDKKTLFNLCANGFSYNLATVLHNVCSSVAGEPDFDVNTLDKNGQEMFSDLTVFISSVARFLPERGGVSAWDISEKIGFTRNAYACGLITEEDFRTYAGQLAELAKGSFPSFEEYLASLVIGSGMFMFIEDDRSIKSAIKFIDQNMPLVLEGDVPDLMWANE